MFPSQLRIRMVISLFVWCLPNLSWALTPPVSNPSRQAVLDVYSGWSTAKMLFNDGSSQSFVFYFFPNKGAKDIGTVGIGSSTYSRR